MSIRSLYTGATGMQGLQTKLDVIANNLANVETTGFKRDRANFEDLLYTYDKLPGVQDASNVLTPVGSPVGMGVRVQSVQTYTNEQGSLRETGQDYDMAINGKGFFRVLNTDGTFSYTRAGNFTRNADGNLALGSASIGRLLDPPIQVPEEAVGIEISPNGTVMVKLADQPEMDEVGQIQLSYFINPGGLLKEGENLYTETEASGPEQEGDPGDGALGIGTIMHKYIEASNVKPVDEMIDLIMTQRGYEMNSKTIQTGDSMLSTAVNLKR